MHRYLLSNEGCGFTVFGSYSTAVLCQGPLTVSALKVLYGDLAGSLNRPLLRNLPDRGDMHHTPPGGPPDWMAERDSMSETYLNLRSDIVLDQFKDAGLYPEVQSPVFSVNGVHQRGGPADVGDELTLDSMDEVRYFTLDGSDPRLAGAEVGPPPEVEIVTLLEESAPKRQFVPSGEIDEAWKGGGIFDDSAWTLRHGRCRVWFYDYQSYIGIDVIWTTCSL